MVSDDAGVVLLTAFVSDKAGTAFLRFFFPTTRAWGAPLPYIPSGTGCERVATLSRSPEAALAGSLVSDDAGAVLLTAFVSDETGTALLKISFPTMQGVSF